MINNYYSVEEFIVLLFKRLLGVFQIILLIDFIVLWKKMQQELELLLKEIRVFIRAFSFRNRVLRVYSAFA